jgi:ATP-dependent helicase HepA
MLNLAEKQAATRLPPLLTTAINKMQAELAQELQRLTELQRVNPNVREDEVESLREQMQLLHRYLQTARLHQDAIRLIIAA